MKIVLINPPDITVVKGISSQNRFFTDLPLGLAYIAAVLEKGGHDVEIIDSVGSKLKWNQICQRLEKSNPDLVGVATVSVTLQSAVALAKKSKEYFPDVPVILGGHGVFRIEDTILQRVNEVDIIVRGEGENTVIELMNTIQGKGSLVDVMGITFRSKTDQIITNPSRPLILDLDSLPFPARHLFPMEAYMKDYKWANLGNESFKGTHLISSRGCCFTCSFCQATRYYGHKWRYRSPKNLVDEIEHLYGMYKQIGLNGFALSDDNFLADRNRAIKICDLMIERGLDHLGWQCQARVDSADEHLYSKLHEAGCRIVGFGVESGDNRVLKVNQKGITTDMVRRAVKMAKDVGLKVWGYFMFGLPGDTDESMMKTLRFSEELDFDAVLYSPTTLLPGSMMGGEENIDWLNFIAVDELLNSPITNVGINNPLHPCAPTYADRKTMIKIMNYVVKRRRIYEAKKRFPILKALRHPFKALRIAIDNLRLGKEKLPTQD